MSDRLRVSPDERIRALTEELNAAILEAQSLGYWVTPYPSDVAPCGVDIVVELRISGEPFDPAD